MKKIVKEITLSSNPESIIEVESFVEDLSSRYNVEDGVFGNMIISITEAVNNAIIHGNKRDSSKSITIIESVEDSPHKLLCIKIKDEGTGFDYNNLPDPTSPENITMIGGRGVYLIKQLADYVIFNDEGNSIELQFRV
ncbi:MAG: serine/threonine-protein kinase RsbW [Planctomycetota bacterium]|jgi:serine/threonine-protein kinase RsbW